MKDEQGPPGLLALPAQLGPLAPEAPQELQVSRVLQVLWVHGDQLAYRARLVQSGNGVRQEQAALRRAPSLVKFAKPRQQVSHVKLASN